VALLAALRRARKGAKGTKARKGAKARRARRVKWRLQREGMPRLYGSKCKKRRFSQKPPNKRTNNTKTSHTTRPVTVSFCIIFCNFTLANFPNQIYFFHLQFMFVLFFCYVVCFTLLLSVLHFINYFFTYIIC
jgi:hypothetical protein